MKFPNKVNRYKTTVISKMAFLLDAMVDRSNGVSELYAKVSRAMTIQEFTEAAVCLYALGMVERDEYGGLIKCSKN